MAFVNKLGAVLTGGAERVVDGPVRAIIEDVLRERGVPGAADLDAARAEIKALSVAQAALSTRVDAAEARGTTLQEQVDRLLQTVDDLQHDLAESREVLVQTQAELAAKVDELAARPAAPEDDRPRVGADGAVLVGDEVFYVDPSHAGSIYTVTKRGGLSVGGRFIKRSPTPVGDAPKQ